MIVILASVTVSYAGRDGVRPVSTIESGGNEPADSLVIVDNIAGMSLINNPDSATITYYHVFDKETSLDVETERAPSLPNFSRSSRLSGKEYKQLYRHLKSKGTYRNAYVLLGHADINIRCYKDGQIVTDIYLSSLTSNITIYVETERAPFLLKKQITSATKSYLTKVLRKHGLWSKEMKFSDIE